MSEQHLPREGREEIEQFKRDNADVGTGLGGGSAPVLGSDVDGATPDGDWLASSSHDAPAPNWAQEQQPLEAAGNGHHAGLAFPRDTHLLSVSGDDLGEIECVYGYEQGEACWASVESGGRHVMVPLISANLDDDGLHVPYPKDLVDSAPEYPEGGMSLHDEMGIYAHYNERRMLPAGSDSERTLLQPLSNAA